MNIFISKDLRAKANRITTKYNVSLTTLCDVLIQVTYYCILHTKGSMTNEELNKNYIYKNETHSKTSIKEPKCLKQELYKELITNKTRYTTNVLKLYLTKEIKNYLDEEYTNMYYNKIDNKLTEIKETFWNYNQINRSTRRCLKENKDYYKRAINELEGK